MRENVLSLSMIGQLLRRRRRLLAVLAVLGALLGAVAALLLPATYQSTGKVLLQGPREKSQVLTEAQIAMSLVVLDRAAAELGWGASGPDLVDAVTAEVAGGNVIAITARADSASRARELGEQIAEQYMTFSTEIVLQAANATREVLVKRQATLDQRVKELNPRIGDLQAASPQLDPRDPQAAASRAELERLRSTRDDVLRELDGIDQRVGEAEAQAAAIREGLRVIEPAVQPTGPVPPTPVHLVAGGAALAVLVGAFVLVAARQADHRLRHRSDIAAAVGAPVLGTVEPPTEPTPERAAEPEPSGAARWLHRLVRFTDPEPSPPTHDPALEYVRYRRVLAQLLASGPAGARLLVVVPAGDVPAFRAVARLATEAAADGRPVRVVPTGSRLSEVVRDVVARSGARDVVVGPRPGPPSAQTAVLDVVDVALARPTIPSRPGVSAALLVVSCGVATAWELLGVAQAGRDAGCPLAGVLLVSATDGDEAPAGPQPLAGAAEPAASGVDGRSYAHV